jgi:rsbT co-antagonist protein RsbR
MHMENGVITIEVLKQENVQLRQRVAELEQQLADYEQQVHAQAEALELSHFALDHATEGIHWLASDGDHVYVNQTACQMLGYSRDELMRMRLPDFATDFPPDAWEQHWQDIKQQGTLTIEARQNHKDGHSFPAEVTIRYTALNGKEYVCLFVHNITERRESKEQLRTLQILVENAPDGIVLANQQGVFTYANPAHRAMSGYGDAIIGMALPQFVAEEDRHRLEQIAHEVKTHGFWKGTIRHRRKDGSIFLSEVSSFLVTDQDNTPIGRAAIVRDISAQQQAEEERRMLQQQLIEAQQTAIRELSTPLIPIADNVLIMPLIGSIDTNRAQQMTEALLEGVAAHRARMVILDITGVQVVDTQVAQAFIQAAQAVRLLGACVLLTGIQPQIAQTLVHLGVDLTGIKTTGSLREGVASALAGE